MKKFLLSAKRALSFLLVVSMIMTSAGVTTFASAPTNYKNDNDAQVESQKETEVETAEESQSEDAKSEGVQTLGEKPEEEVTPEEETSNDAYVAELPGEYQELEFIESKNNAHIDTGVIGRTGVTTEMEVNLITSSSPAYVYGSRGDSGATRFLLARLSSKFDFAVKDDIKSSDWKLNTWYKLNLETTKSGTKLEVKDETGKVLNTKTTSNTYKTKKSIWLFGTNTKSGNWSQAKMKQVKMYEDGLLVRHFVPCYRIEDKVVGMYDLVNDTFYTNANSKNSSATFVPGPEVAKEEDSEEGEEDVPEELDEDETVDNTPDFGPLAENESLAATADDSNESQKADKSSEVEEVVPNVEEATKSEAVDEGIIPIDIQLNARVKNDDITALKEYRRTLYQQKGKVDSNDSQGRYVVDKTIEKEVFDKVEEIIWNGINDKDVSESEAKVFIPTNFKIGSSVLQLDEDFIYGKISEKFNYVWGYDDELTSASDNTKNNYSLRYAYVTDLKAGRLDDYSLTNMTIEGQDIEWRVAVSGDIDNYKYKYMDGYSHKNYLDNLLGDLFLVPVKYVRRKYDPKANIKNVIDTKVYNTYSLLKNMEGNPYNVNIYQQGSANTPDKFYINDEAEKRLYGQKEEIIQSYSYNSRDKSKDYGIYDVIFKQSYEINGKTFKLDVNSTNLELYDAPSQYTNYVYDNQSGKYDEMYSYYVIRRSDYIEDIVMPTIGGYSARWKIYNGSTNAYDTDIEEATNISNVIIVAPVAITDENYDNHAYLKTMFDSLKQELSNEYERLYKNGSATIYGKDANGKVIYNAIDNLENEYALKVEKLIKSSQPAYYYAMFYNKYKKSGDNVYEVSHPDGVVVWEPCGKYTDVPYHNVYEAVKISSDKSTNLPSIEQLDKKKYALRWEVVVGNATFNPIYEADRTIGGKTSSDTLVVPNISKQPYEGKTISINDLEMSTIRTELKDYMKSEYGNVSDMSEDIEKKHIEKLKTYFKDGDFEVYRIFFRPAVKYQNSQGETKYKKIVDIRTAAWMSEYSESYEREVYTSAKMTKEDAYEYYHGKTIQMVRYVGDTTSLFDSFISDKEIYTVEWYTSEDFNAESLVTNATLPNLKKDVYLYPKVTFKEILTSIPTYIKDKLLTSSVSSYQSAKDNLKKIEFKAYELDIDIDENATSNSDTFKKAMDAVVDKNYTKSYDIELGVRGYIYGKTDSFTLTVAIDTNHYHPYLTNDATKYFANFAGLKTITGLKLLDWSSFTKFAELFSNLPNLETLDISEINVTTIESIDSMFKGDESLKSVKLPLALNTKDIDDMSYMFSGCKSLTTIENLDKITLESATHLKDMFAGCPNGLTSTNGIKRFLNHTVITTYTTDLFNALSVDNNVKKIVFETGKDRVSGSTKLKPGVFGYIKDNIVYVNMDYNVTLKMSGDVKSQLDNLSKYELEGFDKVDVKSVTNKVNISYKLGNGASWKKGYTAPKTINFNAELKLDTNNIVLANDKSYVLFGFKVLAIDSNNKTLKDFGYVTAIPTGYPYLNYQVLVDVQDGLELSQKLLYNSLGIKRDEITSIKFVLESNTKPAGTEIVLLQDKLTAYVNGKDVTYVVTDKLQARLPKNSEALFGRMKNVKSITGLNILDGTNVENARDLFADNQNLESIDLTGLKLPNVVNLRGMFWRNYKIKSIDFGGGINTSKVQDKYKNVDGGFTYMFTQCYELTKIRNIKFPDSVNNYGYGSGIKEFALKATKLDDESFQIVRELLPPLVIKAKSRLLYYDDGGFSYRAPYDVDTFRVITYDEFKNFYFDSEKMKFVNETQASLDRLEVYYDSNIGQNKNDIILFAVHLFNKGYSVNRKLNCEKNTRYLVYKKIKNNTLQNLKMNQDSTSLFEKVGNSINPINFYGLDKISANGVKVADNMFKDLHLTSGITGIDKLKFTTLESAVGMFDGCDKLLGATLNINKDTFIDARYMFRNCRSLIKKSITGIFEQNFNPSLNAAGMFYGVTSLSEDDLEYDFDAAPIVKNEKPVTILIDRNEFYKYINNNNNIEKIVIKGVDNDKKQYRKDDFIKELTASAKFDNNKYVTLGSVVDGVVAYMPLDGKTYYIVYDKKHYIPQLPENSSKYFSEPKISKNLKAIEGLENLDYSIIKDARNMFAELTSIEEIDLSNANFESMVHYIDGMFKSCESVKRIALPIKWNTALCQSTERMFYRCLNLENLENLDKLNLDWTHNYAYMFAECAKLKEVQVSHFNMTEEPKYQFDDPYEYNEDRWYIFKNDWQPNIDHMFYGMTNLVYLDLTGWYSRFYGIGDYVFAKCPNLQRIYVKIRKDGANRKYRQEAMFTIISGKDNAHVFEGCDKLTTDFGAKVLDEEYTETISNAVKCSDNNCKEQHYYWDPAKGDTWYEDPWHHIIYNLHDGFVIRDNPRNKVYPFRYHIHKKIGQYDTIYCRPDLGPSFIIDLSTEYKNTWAYGQTKAEGSYKHRGIFTLLEDGKTIPREDLLKGSAKIDTKGYAKRMINAKQIASEYPYAGIDADCELLINVLYHLDNNETYYETLSFGDKFKTDMDTEDKEFLGWYLTEDFSGDKVESITEDILDTNIDLFAKYKNKYKIEVHDGYTHTVNKYLKADDEPYELPTPSRDGYVFLGWYLDSGYKNKVTEITEIAKLDTNEDHIVDIYGAWCKIVVHNGYNNTLNKIVSFDEKYVLQDASRDGYIFLGWYLDEGLKSKVTTLKDLTANAKYTSGDFVVNIYASWAIKEYTIKYNNIYDSNVTLGMSGTYVFDGERVREKRYENSLDVRGKYIAIPAMTNDGYDFKGWYYDKNFTKPLPTIEEIDKNEILGPKFEYYLPALQMEKVVNIYAKLEESRCTITYDLSGANGQFRSGYTPPTKRKWEDTVALPLESDLVYDRSKYIFTGWKWTSTYTDGRKFGYVWTAKEIPGSVKHVADVQAKANFEISYLITYNLAGGNWAKNYVPVTRFSETQQVYIPAHGKVVREGYKLLGWKDKDDLIFTDTTNFRVGLMVPEGTTHAKEFTAVWRKLYKYDMIYDLNGGSWASGFKPQTIITEEEVMKLPDANKLTHKDGLVFDGWYVPNTETEIVRYTPKGNIQKVEARWKYGKLDVKVNSQTGVETYISDIKMSVSSNEANAKAALTLQGYTLIPNNLNEGAGGKYIYIGYKKTRKATEAIRGIGERWFNATNRNPKTYTGSNQRYSFTAVTDFNGTQWNTNESANDGSRWVYLYTTKDQNAGAPITNISVYTTSYASTLSAVIENNNYKAVVNSNDGSLADFNRGNNGKRIYIRYK